MSQFALAQGTTDPNMVAVARHISISTDFPLAGTEGNILVSQGPDSPAQWLPNGSSPPTSHVIANTAGLGAQHTTSGLTAGMVLRATAAAAAAFGFLLASDLPAHNHDASAITTGTLDVARGGTGVSSPTSGNLLVGAGGSAMTLLAPGVAGGYVRSNGAAWVRNAGVPGTDVTGNIAYAQLPTGGGTWANGGTLSITGGVTTLAGLISTASITVNPDTVLSSQNLGLNINNATFQLAGGTGGGSANIVLFGGAHATTPNEIRFRQGTTVVGTFLTGTGAFIVGTDPGGGGVIRATGGINLTASGTQTGTSVEWDYKRTDAGVDSKTWNWFPNTTQFLGRILSDDRLSALNWLAVTRAGMAISSVAFPNPPVVIGSDPGGSETFRVGGGMKTSGNLVFTAAASQLVPGATSFSVRNNANTADNLKVDDNGTVTVRLTLILAPAVSTIVPGATSFAVRNNANGADNILIADSGATTFRAGLSGITTLSMSGQLTSTLATGTAPFVVASTTKVANLNADFLDDQSGAFYLDLANATGNLAYARLPTGGGTWANGGALSITGGVTTVAGLTSSADITAQVRLVFTTAASKIVPGATSLSLRNNADAADNILIADAGAVTFRAGLSGITTLSLSGQLTSTLVTGTAPFVVASTTKVANLNADFLDDQSGAFYLDLANATGNLAYARLPTGGGTWANGGTLSITGGVTTVAGLTSSADITAQARLVFTTAVGKIVPGATSLSLRNNADAADNILVADGGAITFRAGLSGITTLSLSGAQSGGTTLSLAGPITLTTAASKIIPGATSLSLRSNADAADNLLLTDAGLATFRNTVTVSTGDVVVAGMVHGRSAGTSGVAFRVGDDLTISDAGIANTAQLQGLGAATQAFLNFGSGNGLRAGFDGTNAIYDTTGFHSFLDDIQIGSLGRFDSSDAPLDGQILFYHGGSTNKWQAESFQLIYNAGDAQVAVNVDSTSAQFVYLDPGAGADSPVGAPPVPVLKLFPYHKGVTVVAYASTVPDIEYHDGASFPADFRHTIYEYSLDNFGTAAKSLATASGDKVNHGRLTPGTTYYYRARVVDRAGNASANSAVVSFVATANSDSSNFGIVLATEMAVDRLAAISVNAGVITAGQLRNTGNTTGLNLGGAGGIPGTWTSGINLEAAAGSGSMTRYINLTATGANPFIKHELLSLNADGSASFGGRLLVVNPTLSVTATGTIYHDIGVSATPTVSIATFTHMRIASSFVAGAGSFTDFANLDVGSLTSNPAEDVTNYYQIRVFDTARVGGSVGTLYGIQVRDLGSGTTNYAIHTGTGLVRIGDDIVMGALVSRLRGGATSFAVRNNANSSDNVLIADAGHVTIRGRLTVGSTDSTTVGVQLAAPATGTAGTFPHGVFAAQLITAGAASQTLRAMTLSPTFATGGFATLTYAGLEIFDITGGTTNYSLYTGAGLVRFGDDIVMGAAVARLRGGATSFAIRNNANGADNLLIADAGGATFRSSVVMAGALSGVTTFSLSGAQSGGTTLSLAGPITLTTAVSKLIPGATSFAIRNNADSADNLLIADAGDLGFRTFFEQTEMSAPATPAANKTRDYAKDLGGVSTRVWKDDAGVEHPHNLTLIDTQTFTATGAFTWTKPAGAVLVRVVVIGAGGGGAGGSGDINGIQKKGASGGGGGAFIDMWFRAPDLGGTEAGSVGAGGTAGTGGVSGNGTAGGAGGDSWFGNATQASAKVWAYGGGAGASNTGLNIAGGGGGGITSAGANGTTATTLGGGPSLGADLDNTGFGGGGSGLNTAGRFAVYGGGGGGGAGGNAATAPAGGKSHFGGGGGGGGGGVSAADLQFAGGAGGDNKFSGTGGGGAGGAVTGGAGTAGADGDAFRCGQGGGGGGANNAGTGGAGGAGGTPGGGGGGGGAGENLGGGGGVGRRGEVRVYTYA